MRFLLISITVGLAIPCEARDANRPAPIQSPQHTTSQPRRSYDYAAPVGVDPKKGDMAPAPIPKPEDQKPTGTGTGTGQQDQPPQDNIPTGNGDHQSGNSDDFETKPGDGGSNTSNDRAATPPGQPTPFPQIGGVQAGGGKGAGQPPQGAQFQPIPGFEAMPLPTNPNEANLTSLLGAATQQLGKTLNGDRLTALTDSIGEQMKAWQQTVVGIMETQSNITKQGLLNAQNRSGFVNNPQTTQSFNNYVSSVQSTTGNPRVGATGSNSGMQPRANPTASMDQLATTQPVSRQPASGGNRGRLMNEPTM
jgi:hypothetical protein